MCLSCTLSENGLSLFATFWHMSFEIRTDVPFKFAMNREESWWIILMEIASNTGFGIEIGVYYESSLAILQ